MRALLLYHVYPINHWKDVTAALFDKLPFERVVVHASIPDGWKENKEVFEKLFEQYGVHDFLYSPNSGKGEVDAMRKLMQHIDISQFDILSYMHCKGVTKPTQSTVRDWTMLMRYFLIEKMGLCKKVFRSGFVTFGVNKSIPNKEDEGFSGSNFFYEGNFVSLNLKKVDLKTAVKDHLEDSYYGLEGFWGKLCPAELGYSAFDSGINHYMLNMHPKDYTTVFGRLRYKMVKKYYRFKMRKL